MPKKLESMRKSIKGSLVKQGYSPKEAESRSWPIAKSQWKEMSKNKKKSKTRKSDKTIRHRHTRHNPNGSTSKVRSHWVKVGKHRKKAFVGRTPTYSIQDPKTGYFIGSTSNRRSKK